MAEPFGVAYGFPPDRRKAILRGALFWAGYFAFVMASFLGLGMPGVGTGRGRSSAGQWCLGILLTAFAPLWTRLCRRLEGFPQTSPAPTVRHSTAQVGYGLLIGLAIMGACYLSLPLLVPGLTFALDGSMNAAALPASIALFLLLAAAEEPGFRGYPMRRLLSSFGVWPTQFIVGIMFCIYHIVIGWDRENALAGTVLASFLFGMAALASPKGLALPVGVHAGVNVATWSIGGQGEAGIWKMLLDPSLAGRAQAVGRVSYGLFMLLGTAGLWTWNRRARSQTILCARTIKRSGAAPTK
jgi:membrane protease YdiL (CAAX protease family)